MQTPGDVLEEVELCFSNASRLLKVGKFVEAHGALDRLILKCQRTQEAIINLAKHPKPGSILRTEDWTV